MKRRFNLTLTVVLLAGVGLALVFCLPARATMQPREVMLISDNLTKVFKKVQFVHRQTRRMEEEARPFLRPNYARHYRFEPSQKNARAILSENRLILDRMRLLAGTLYHAPMPDLPGLMKRFYTSNEAVTTFTKRALRAVKDHNFALYLASAQGIEKEARLQADLLRQVELLLNDTIERADDEMEDL